METVIVVIADLSFAADKANPSTSASRAQLTARVCPGCYVAPELLAFREVEDAAPYDLSVDVWSAAVVTYEVVSLVRFIVCDWKEKGIAMLTSCIAGRLGEVLLRNVCPWQHDIAEPWQSLIAMGLKRRAEERSSAECVAGSQPLVLAAQRNNSSSSVAETGSTASSRPPVRTEEDTWTSNPASPRIQEPEGSFPLRLEGHNANMYRELNLDDGRKCACSGNCGHPTHRKNKCHRQYVVIGSKFCRDCECTWMDCHGPRVWGPYCKRCSAVP